ncbi:MAG: 1-deoxy-D-xylulose-5-phosphate synthase [Eubacteriales bacterium]|nr:1-deoxy-D-xylulose-5-phosphate synthase [Eubacteriales bacterium]
MKMEKKNQTRYGLLDREDLPAILGSLSRENLDELCVEIRQFLLDHVSRTGGHLASNLGVVELTVALHRCFDTSRDRLVFDVGHQCYTHKILTGRKEQFEHLRQFGGISGFLKPEESEHDACITGHASASISIALGMAHARTILQEEYSVVAVIGDGALTGGMAYEALNSAGASREPLIIVLNDNNMSIDQNVGAMNRHLQRLRVRPKYLRMKQDVRQALDKMPAGERAANLISKSKRAVKSALLPGSMFEQMGFTYLGPVDGHDILAVCELLEIAKQMKKPVLIHALTRKGKGYSFAEQNPNRYHGVSQFDVSTGLFLKQSSSSFSSEFGKEMVRLAKKDPRICAITAAMPSGTGLSDFSKTYPKRFFDVGIAEEHAVAMSCGMAKRGLRPVCALYSTFLQRSFDQLIHDAAIDHIPLIVAIDRAGIVGEDGATHNGVFDVGFLRQIPGMTLLAPSNYAELRSMLQTAVFHMEGPIALRYPRGGEGAYQEDHSTSDCVCLQEGTDVVLVSYGIMINEALQAASILREYGVSTAVYKINNLTADFSNELLSNIVCCGHVAVIEDVVHAGSIGQSLAETLACQAIETKWIRLFHTGSSFAPQGTVRQIYEQYHLDGKSVAEICLEAIKA